MSAKDQVLDAIRELMNQYKSEEISITVSGHCLGASLAIMNSTDIVANGYNKPQYMVTVFAFSSPKVGNSDFVTRFNKLNHLHLLHIRHFIDPVPKLPPGSSYSEMRVLLSITKTDFSVLDLLRGGHIILSIIEMLFRFHHLKNLLTTVEKQQEKVLLASTAATPTISAVVGTTITNLDKLNESNLVVGTVIADLDELDKSNWLLKNWRMTVTNCICELLELKLPNNLAKILVIYY
ncbi:uncharacterized protein LOC123205348 [Mangifera indica]|uniref:uncharacterized protein LOC123205348 n=1 Tax=Mangifera indica TaxID=29780 RepID=UPI001CFB6722|nr:uncharacterized protein LOC123205348 [Mangifera indica]